MNTFKSADGRVWVIDEKHPDSDERVVVCRAFHCTNGRRWLGHTALFMRKELVPTVNKELNNA